MPLCGQLQYLEVKCTQHYNNSRNPYSKKYDLILVKIIIYLTIKLNTFKSLNICFRLINTHVYNTLSDIALLTNNYCRIKVKASSIFFCYFNTANNLK